MNNTVIEIMFSIGGSFMILMLGIIGFFLRRIINNIENVNTNLSGLDLGVKVLNVELKNNTRDVVELKAEFNASTKTMVRRMDKQAEKIQENRDYIIDVKAEQRNCPAKNILKTG